MAVETIASAHVQEHIKQWEHSTWTTELLLACGAVVLSILGIVGLLQTDLAAVAVIGLGAILLFQGANVAMRYTEILYKEGATDRVGAADISQGIAGEFLAGVAGIVLGILALLRIVPVTLMSVAVITYGGMLLVTSRELIWMTSLSDENEIVCQLMRSMSFVAAGIQALVGAAALVLGILALVGIAPVVMILVALLATGASILLRSSLVGGFLLSFLRM